MELSKKLKEQGWYLTDDGIKKLVESTATEDVNKIVAAALNLDLREIGGGALPTKREEQTIAGRIVLQIQKIRNVSAPKSNEDSKVSPRFLQLDLCDGVTTLQALELEPVPALNTNVAPGTKLFFRAEKLQLMQGFLILRAAEVVMLGGRVNALYEKWDIARTMQQFARNGRIRSVGSGGPPPWVPFGKKLDAIKEAVPNEREFKSLVALNDKDKEPKENDEFNNMRNEAIATAAKAGAKKVFGGGGQQIIDHNVKKILEKGYSEEEAKNALRATNNNLERALYSLKRRNSKKPEGEASSVTIHSRYERHGGRRGGGGKDDAEITKPATNVCLFDFVTNKLPITDTPTYTATATLTTTNNVANNKAQNTGFKQNHQTETSNSSKKYQPNKTGRRSGGGKDDVEITKAAADVTNKQAATDKATSSASVPTNTNFRQNHITDNSNAAKKYQSNKGDEQPKFENNISSSFALNHPRDVGGGGAGRRGGRNDRGGRGGRGERGARPEQELYNANTRKYNDRYQDTNQKPYGYENSRSFVSKRKPLESAESLAENSNAANVNPFKQDIRTKDARKMGAAENRASYRENNYDKKRDNERPNGNNVNAKADNSKRQQIHSTAPAVTGGNNKNNASNNNNKEDFNKRMNKLSEATSNMKIDSKADKNSAFNQQRAQPQQKQQHIQQQHQPQKQHHQQAQQQQQHQQQQQQRQNAPSQYAAHPTNKQQQAALASDTAAVAEASQAAAVLQKSNAGNTYNQMPNGYSYDPSKIVGFQSKEANEFAMNLLKSQGVTIAPQTAPIPVPTPPPPPPPPQAPQQSQLTSMPSNAPYIASSSMHYPPPTYVVPPPQPTITPSHPTMPNQYGMISDDAWHWKVGDLCFAKYWDDGRYYDAEITGVTERTCMVLFLGYGNYEEVLKSDCLPITDGQHMPINTSQASQNPYNMQNPIGDNSGNAQRYRGERQMYVPPHKRHH